MCYYLEPGPGHPSTSTGCVRYSVVGRMGGGSVSSVGGEGGQDLEMLGFLPRTLANKNPPPRPTKDNEESGVRRQMR